MAHQFAARDFIEEAADNFRTVASAESELRGRMVEDWEFSNGKIWPLDKKSERESDGRPCIETNRAPEYINQVVNQIRINRPAVQVNPVDGGADVDTAEALQGIIRSIESNSDADVVYATAADHQIRMGRGYWRVLTEYTDDFETEQDIFLRRIRNPFTVYMDPMHQRLDGSDARYCFIVEDIPLPAFRRLYGVEATDGFLASLQIGDKTPLWYPNKCVRVAEYYYRDTSKRTIVRIEVPSMSNPAVKGEITVDKKAIPDGGLPDGWRVLREREVEASQIKWCKINGFQVLEGNDSRTAGSDWPGKYIPVCQAIGYESDVNGKIDIRGMVRDAKEPIRKLAYWDSAATENIALTPRAPYIGYEGQFRGHEIKWNMANRKSFAYLEVAKVSVDGQPAPLPQRQQFTADISAFVEMMRIEDMNLKSVMGLYGPSLGAPGPEQTGRAILARQQQGQVGFAGYIENFNVAIRHCGRIVLDMIPRVYPPKRIARILGADEQSRRVIIVNGAGKEDVDALRAAEGIDRIYDVNVGRYDINIAAGPSYYSRRQEAVQAMLQLVNSYPAVAPIIGDLLVKNMDWPGAQEVAARLRTLVPPQVLQGENGQPAIPPEVMQQVQAMQTRLQELEQERAAKVLDIQSRERIEQMNLAARERMTTESNRITLLQAAAKIQGDRALAQLKAEADLLSQRLDHAHERSITELELSTPDATATDVNPEDTALTRSAE